MKLVKEISKYTLVSIIGLMPLILLITYLTYSEKYVIPSILIIMLSCLFNLRKEF